MGEGPGRARVGDSGSQVTSTYPIPVPLSVILCLTVTTPWLVVTFDLAEGHPSALRDWAGQAKLCYPPSRLPWCPNRQGQAVRCRRRHFWAHPQAGSLAVREISWRFSQRLWERQCEVFALVLSVESGGNNSFIEIHRYGYLSHQKGGVTGAEECGTNATAVGFQLSSWMAATSIYRNIFFYYICLLLCDPLSLAPSVGGEHAPFCIAP